MSTKTIDKIIDLIKKQAVGTKDIVTCKFQGDFFVDKNSRDWSSAHSEMGKKLHDIVLLGSHPFMNPFFDVFLKYETRDIDEAFEIFVKENSSYQIEECTQEQDVLSLYIDLELLAINCLPLQEDKTLKLISASIQTALFRYDIEE